MRDFAIAYLAAALVMGGLDFTWLALSKAPVYERGIGALLAPQPNMAAALAFYALYLAGVVFFAVQPALARGSWAAALLPGALFVLTAYGTYDLTNMATLKEWPLYVTVVDMAWGAALTTVTAGISAAAVLAFRT